MNAIRAKLIVLAVSAAILACLASAPAAAQTGDHLLITHVQISGTAGQTTNDFVELYNPTIQPINLKGYRLVKRSAHSTSDTSLKSWTAGILIPAHSYYLWANSGYTNIGVIPSTTTSGTLSSDNAVGLRLGAANSGPLIDSLAWGKAANSLGEGTNIAANPSAGQMLARKLDGTNYQDTNSNSDDFSITPSATPHADQTQTPAAPTTTTLTANPTATKKTSAPLTNGTKAGVTGIIVAPPGMFTQGSAFLAEPNVRLVLAGRNYPVLQVGDQVLVHGAVSTGVNGTEIQVTSPKNIVRQGSGEAPAPQHVALTEVSNNLINTLITTEGTVSKTSRTTFTITDEGKTLRVALKNKQMGWPNVILGDQATVTGIVAAASGELQLWPRSENEVVLTEAAPTPQAPSVTESKTAPNSNGYLVLGLAVLFIGGAYLWQRYKLPNARELVQKIWRK